MPSEEPKNPMRKVGTIFREIGRMSGPGPRMGPGKKPETLGMDDYAQFCHALLGKEIPLTDELLEKRILYLAQNGKLKLHLPEGSKCCLTIVPCDRFANKLEENGIKSGAFLRFLVVPKTADENNNKDGTITLDPKFDVEDQLLYSALPEEAQKAGTFDVHYSDQDPYAIDPKDRTEIIENHTAAYKSLQALFNPTIH
jgi:hypothetical protein